ncbi:MAG: hypothetical protein V9H69_15625 [Anaerolineae bacterium]
MTVHRLPITVHGSRFTDHRSPFTDHRSPFTVHRSPFTDHRSPFTVHRSPPDRSPPDRSPPDRSRRSIVYAALMVKLQRLCTAGVLLGGGVAAVVYSRHVNDHPSLRLQRLS